MQGRKIIPICVQTHLKLRLYSQVGYIALQSLVKWQKLVYGFSLQGIYACEEIYFHSAFLDYDLLQPLSSMILFNNIGSEPVIWPHFFPFISFSLEMFRMNSMYMCINIFLFGGAGTQSELVPSWFPFFNKELVHTVSFSDHEAFDHPVACKSFSFFFFRSEVQY